MSIELKKKINFNFILPNDFNLFKSKPKLKDLIPNGFVDIHSHILPGIDDGAKDINESKLLVNGMMNMGFQKFTEPHIHMKDYTTIHQIL